MGGNAMTSRPAAPESEKKIAPGDALLEAYKLAERVIKPSSMYGATAQQLASALLTNKEITTEFAEEYETVKRRLSLAQTEIKGHMRVEDELQARIAELERILRLYQGGRRGWEKEGMLAGEWLKIQEQFDAAVNEVLKDRA